jgi:hypothetical protein
MLQPEVARMTIDNALKHAQKMMTTPSETAALGIKQPLDMNVTSFKYPSGSVDGMLTIRAVPSGLKIHDLMLDLENTFRDVPEAWISIGYRYSAPGRY